jgi:very-short-patch-repair endonuclease
LADNILLVDMLRISIALRLVVEIEGDIHNEAGQQEYDRTRFEELELRGLRILRFSNSEVLQNTEGVLQQIVAVKNEVWKK